jgi:hypothetical protein
MEPNAKQAGSKPDAEGVVRGRQGNLLVRGWRIRRRIEELESDGSSDMEQSPTPADRSCAHYFESDDPSRLIASLNFVTIVICLTLIELCTYLKLMRGVSNEAMYRRTLWGRKPVSPCPSDGMFHTELTCP